MVLLIVVYGLAKFATLLERPKSAMKVQTSTERGVFDADYEFKSSDGLSIAAAFTKLDSDGYSQLLPSIVTLDFKYLTWDLDSTGKVVTSEQTIPSHQCTDAELGIG